MRRLAAAILLLAASVPSFAQVRTVGLLWNDTVVPSPYRATVIAALKEKGHVVGQNLRIEDRVSLQGYAGMPKGAAELAAAKVDVILTYGSTATVAALKASGDIPVVMIIGADPVVMGFTSSLARPSGNVTGVATVQQEVTSKRLELLKELVPGASRFGVLFAPESRSAGPARREVDRAATALKVAIEYAEVRVPDEIGPAIARLAKSRIDAFYIHGSVMLAAHAPEVVALVGKHRLPAVYSNQRHFEAGGLIAYGPDIHDAFAAAAGYADRILKGAKPRDLPIERVSKLVLEVNLGTARAQGIAIPPSILARADRVLE